MARAASWSTWPSPACALAEVAWSPQEGKDKANFLQRLAEHEKRLNALKVNYRKADGKAAQPEAPLVSNGK